MSYRKIVIYIYGLKNEHVFVVFYKWVGIHYNVSASATLDDIELPYIPFALSVEKDNNIFSGGLKARCSLALASAVTKMTVHKTYFK
jgi:hypothetical protein